MKTVFSKHDRVTNEMILNNKLYDEMEDEYSELVFAFLEDELDSDKYDFERLHFMRRMLSVIEEHDIPYEAAVGLYPFRGRLELLARYREKIFVDEDDDADVFNFIVGVGLRFYDVFSAIGHDTDDVYEKLCVYQRISEEIRNAYDY